MISIRWQTARTQWARKKMYQIWNSANISTSPRKNSRTSNFTGNFLCVHWVNSCFRSGIMENGSEFPKSEMLSNCIIEAISAVLSNSKRADSQAILDYINRHFATVVNQDDIDPMIRKLPTSQKQNVTHIFTKKIHVLKVMVFKIMILKNILLPKPQLLIRHKQILQILEQVFIL